MFLTSCLMFFIVASQNVPEPRYAQASALVKTKFYFFGGILKTGIITNEVWYLDLGSLSNATIQKWSRSNASMSVAYHSGTSCVSTIDNSTILLIGGVMYTPNTPNLNFNEKIYVFNSKKPQWNLPKIIGNTSNFVMRNKMQAVINRFGQIFISGGQNFTSNNSSSIMYNDMNLLLATDHSNMLWTIPPVTGTPPTSFTQYTATLLTNNGRIVYIGGIQETQANSVNLMTKFKVFNTLSYSWSDQSTYGDVIEPRAGHSAVVQNGIIIIYGGYATNINNTLYSKVTPDVAKLDTTTWIWSIPTISKTNAPPLLALHSAALYGNYMIVAFGLNVSGSTGLTPDTNLLNNNIYILNIQNNTWVTTIPATTTKKPTATSTKSVITNQSSESSNHKILPIAIGIGVGGAIIVGVLSFAGYWYYKRRRRVLNSIQTPGSNMN
ncbi:galactose oxidase [Gigaspora margarita]|uniref:Galactose oxidase n=2 Tax=Gigaspora margarita TaxID=4874 RepID=A0A8H4EK52_GIGMA|nr:galactose oxidase [Gigaspora margarita]